MRILPLAIFLSLLSATAHAFPPAPPTTLYGMVRGEFGFSLDDGETALVLLADGVEIARATINDLGLFDENYRLTLPIDLDPDVGTYRDGTVTEDPSVVYVIVAERGDLRIPVAEINAAVDTFVPKVGGLFRMDFTLGADTDKDGLPDVWELFQIASVRGAQLGVDPLSFLSREGNFDGDELTDWAEYVAGTFALLNEDSLSFEIVEIAADGRTSIEFLAVDGKSYRIEASVDAKTWAPIELETSGETPQTVSAFRANRSQMETIHVIHSLPIQRTFYRLLAN
jgi:hypothetical protein